MTDQGFAGYSIFQNTSNLKQGFIGYTIFIDYYGRPIYHGFGGYTIFEQSYEFPPVGLSGNVWYSVFDIPMFETTKVSFESVEQRISNAPDVRYKYRIHWQNLSQTDIDLLIDFFVARRGKSHAFTWRHPISDEIKVVRFDADLAEIEYVFYQLYSFNEITLIDVDETVT